MQCHIVGDAIPLGTVGAYDGVAELWFDSQEDLVKAFNEPRYLEIIRPDELKFVDHHRCISFITEEIPIA